MQYIALFITSIYIVLLFFLIILNIYFIIIILGCRGLQITPAVTSSSKSIKKIINYLEEYIQKTKKQKIRILDIGSGYGTMLFNINKALTKSFPNKKIEFTGYEIQKIPYKISKLLNKSTNITLIKDDINNLKDFNFDVILTFILKKQQKQFLHIYGKFPKNTIIIANSLPIPFNKKDSFKLVETIKVCYRWNIFIYNKLD
ncbi:hypothetical protein ACFL0U_04660 [Pseudomonadota bacterium]